MIETYQNADLRFTYDSDAEIARMEVISGDDLEKLKIEFNILEYDPDLYDQIASSFRRMSMFLRANYDSGESRHDSVGGM